ncbi:MAG TPA: family 43 glycosylhydrolase [Candidatus Dormibacteraeota bacterium]|nr:family 43 glycosylhydrolase [Candidatus Dormibacteraeota bacterium]
MKAPLLTLCNSPRRCLLVVVFFTWALLPLSATVLDPNLPIHDPSRMVKSGKYWWIFATGDGIDVKYSPDKVHWFQGTPVFAVNNHDAYWAPDIWGQKIHGKFYLFYSQPTAPFGSKGSRIGVTASHSLSSPHWKDQGTIIATSDDTNYNTIDPCPFYDEESDRLWITFGSWFGGIYIVELDPYDPTHMVSDPQRIAGGKGFGIEASYLMQRDGWFYLFANWDLCCRGGLSNYKIVVGRSRTILGPYLDKDGIDMRDGGGSMFMAGAGAEIGPGHFAEAHVDDDRHCGEAQVCDERNENEVNAFTFHTYVPYSLPGPARLAERKIVWQNDGWPRVDFPAPIPAGDYRIRLKIDNLYLAVRNDSTDPLTEAHVEQADGSTNRPSFVWTFVPTPEKYYNIRNMGTGFYADVINGLKLGGDFLREWWPVDLDTNEAQQWRVIDLGDGTYEIQSVRSGRVFDDFAFGINPGNPIWLWDWLYGDNQVFYLEPVH